MVDSFVRDVQQGHEEFLATAPYESENVDHVKAFKLIESAKTKLETSRKKVDILQLLSSGLLQYFAEPPQRQYMGSEFLRQYFMALGCTIGDLVLCLIALSVFLLAS